MASLTERLRAAMTEARKRRDPARTLLLSTILSDIKNREFELHHDASDDETAEVRALEEFLPAAMNRVVREEPAAAP